MRQVLTFRPDGNFVRLALTDRLSGFTVGGDDYVTKPFDIEEVVARLHALLRRAGAGPEAAVADGAVILDPSQLTVSCGAQSEALTPTEFRLLAALAGRTGRAVSRQELISTAWPLGAVVQDNTLDVYIARIRRKLRALQPAPAIKTVHGLGYRLQ